MLKANFNTESISYRIGTIFMKFGIPPNAWTLISIIPAGVGFACLYYGELIFALIFFILSGFFDAVDGAVARVTGTVSDKGAYTDGIVDRYVEILLYLGLLVYGLNKNLLSAQAWSSLICILIFGAVMTSFTRAYADHRKIVTDPKDLKKMGGILERAERLILIFIGMLAGYFNPAYLAYAVILAAILANFTAFQRIMFVIKFKK